MQAIAAGAQLLADAVTSFIEPTSKRGVSDKAEFSFAKAYSSLGSAIPSQSRLAVFQEMAKALAQAIKEAEALRITGVQEELAMLPDAGNAQAENDAFMADMRSQEQVLRMQDIGAKRLLSSAEMRKRLGVTSQALSAAVRAKRMFVLAGPSGENFYPAFFANEKYDRSVLAKKCYKKQLPSSASMGRAGDKGDYEPTTRERFRH